MEVFIKTQIQGGVLIVLDNAYSKDDPESKVLDQLRKSFQKDLRFKLDGTLHNPTDKKMLRLLKQLAAQDYSNVKCFVLLVNSHASHQDVFRVKDGNVIGLVFFKKVFFFNQFVSSKSII
jgi:hypothetical protein